MKTAFGFAALLAGASAFALDRPTRQVQIESKILELGPGVISADFGLNLGHVYANLPSDLAAGDRVSGSLAVFPKGKSDADRSANAAPMSALAVEICGSTFSVSKGLFVCPRVSPEGVDIKLLLATRPLGRLLAKPKVSVPPRGPSFLLPAEGIDLGRSRILGPFGGDFGATSVSIGGLPAPLMAESPRSCIFEIPAGPPGLTQIALSENGSTAAGVFRRIGLVLTPPTPIIHTGDTTSFSAEVTGLAGLERPLTLNLRNLSPDVAAMEGGDEQTLKIAPSDVTASGSFAITRKITGKHRGDYVVNVSVPWDAPAGGAR